jgi:hypothetical protein
MRFRNSPRIVILLGFGSLILFAISIGTARTQEKPKYQVTGSEGTILGTISFAGKPPEPLRIDMSADEICQTENPDPSTDWIVVTRHKLANVVIYVRGGLLNTYSFEAPSPEVTLEHKGCQYVPHVLGMQTSQTLKVFNSDQTVHNTRAMPKNNPEWNQSQPPGKAAIDLRFRAPELFVPMRDNQHPWEKAYVGVFSHPFFSVSATDGSYRISGVPPGQYTVVAWHEKLGEQTVNLFLAGSEQRSLDFTFKAADH